MYLASLVVLRNVPGDTLAWYHTGDEDFDELMDRNYDTIEKLAILLGAGFAEAQYRKRIGVKLFWHVAAAYLAKSGADNLGYYLSRTIDPDSGGSRWNEFHERVYSWYGLEEYEIFDVGIGLLPNPLELAAVTGESIHMLAENYEQYEKTAVANTLSILPRVFAGRILSAPAVNPFFLAEQIYYYTNPSYRVGTGMGDY